MACGYVRACHSVVVLAICVVTPLTGCRNGGGAAAPRPARDIQAVYDGSGVLRRLTWDSDRDGKADVWGVMNGMRLLALEIDEDGDRRVDRWEHYSGDAAARATSAAGQTMPPADLMKLLTFSDVST